MTAAEALRTAVAQLAAAGVPDPARDARLLLAHAMGIAPDRVTLHLPDALSPDASARYADALARRSARHPVSHITGQRLFWGRSFRVTPDVLDPRPETETLIAEALSRPFTRVLDLGTGSGAILLTLLAERPLATGLATDLSPAALTVAQVNAEALALTPRARFTLSDWLASVEGLFDLIVSNPPYIAESEMTALSPEVLHEPRMALTPGGDGLAPYRALASAAPRHLTPGGRLMVEIGPTQGEQVAELFAGGGLQAVQILPDLDGRDRVVSAHRAT
ncbi:peptide chain release factor N(5)-glutamine methyltransferase [Pararhodobacter zhoushanensis]|uniref:Release factor glutamine methyltransferase n=1 Tax=Pararhodobacter zhoushanensis TaxID=2479545 RepID=A0ABT3H356_9RHOB|nr:peptide chain release factor N(5)-glutamine methyltransferase [Pararhodobacter zhoushanensis]MCW1934188.1 peptide chain release factor N(5)-glutamine methyltransferase [Pararhodobacter zhoushanensis]